MREAALVQADATDPAIAIGPVRITPMTGATARARIQSALAGSSPLCVAFCNAHTAMLALKRPAFAETLRGMLVLNDGLGIDLAARLLGFGPFPENLNGTDFVPALLRDSPRPLRLFLLGAQPDVLARADAALTARYPHHDIVGRQHGFFSDADLPAIADRIVAADADIVLCAMGNPRQEDVIAALAKRNVARVLIGVGALFDFLAEAVPRAPPLLRKLRVEFLYRLAQEPQRLGRRYTVEIAEFLVAVVKLRFARADG